MHASELVKNLSARNNKINFYGIGGNNLKKSGVELIFDYNVINYIGFFSIIKNYLSLKNYFNKTIKLIKELNPDIVILVDFPGFNLKISKSLRKFYKGQIVYYISPQIWAWHKNRINIIKKTVDKMLVIFPFEVNFYKQEGIDVTYVGHPLQQKLFYYKDNYPEKKSDKLRVAILPGSRIEEIKHMLPVLVETAQKLYEQFNTEINIICSPNINVQLIKTIVSNSNFNLIQFESNNEEINYTTIYNSDLVISKSGTSTLECCFLETPFCVVYKTSYFNYFIAKLLIKVKFLSIVNILADKQVVKEFLQKDFNVDNLLKEAKKLLFDDAYRNKMITNFQDIKKNMFELNTPADAGEIINDMLK